MYITMSKVAEYLAQLLQTNFPNLQLKLEYSVRCGWRKLPLRIDAAIVAPSGHVVMLLELDGAQHFRPCFDKSSYPLILERDVDKETWTIVRSLVMLRLFQEDVNDCKFDWKRLIHETLVQCLTGKLRECIVRQPNCVQYMTGDYARLRLGTHLA